MIVGCVNGPKPPPTSWECDNNEVITEDNVKIEEMWKDIGTITEHDTAAASGSVGGAAAGTALAIATKTNPLIGAAAGGLIGNQAGSSYSTTTSSVTPTVCRFRLHWKGELLTHYSETPKGWLDGGGNIPFQKCVSLKAGDTVKLERIRYCYTSAHKYGHTEYHWYSGITKGQLQ